MKTHYYYYYYKYACSITLICVCLYIHVINTNPNPSLKCKPQAIHVSFLPTNCKAPFKSSHLINESTILAPKTKTKILTSLFLYYKTKVCLRLRLGSCTLKCLIIKCLVNTICYSLKDTLI